MALHKHQCPTPTCRYIWSHDDSDIRTEADNTRFHTCINCGAESYWKYFVSDEERKAHVKQMRAEDFAAMDSLAQKVADGEISMLEALVKVLERDL